MDFGESCLYAAAAAAASIVGNSNQHQQHQQQCLTPPSSFIQNVCDPLTSPVLVDPCGPPPPPPPPPYVPHQSSLFLPDPNSAAMEVKVEPDTLMDEYSPVSSYVGQCVCF